MADAACALHELSGLCEVGVLAGAVDKRADLALSEDRAGVDRVAGFARRGERLAGERRLVHLDRVAVEQARVSRHDVAEAHADDVARHKVACRRRAPLAIALHPGRHRQLGLQGVDGLSGRVLLGEADHGVGEQQDEDDEEVRPVLQHAGQDHRDFDHPRDWAPEVGEELEELIGLLLFDLIRPVLGEALLCLGAGETVGGVPETLFHLRKGKGLEVIVRRRLCAWLRRSL